MWQSNRCHILERSDMPLYEYRCPECGCEQQAILPFSSIDFAQICVNCGAGTNRRISLPQPAIIKATGRERVLGTLNQEPGAPDFPGGDMHRPRYEAVMSKGLDQSRPVVGCGF